MSVVLYVGGAEFTGEELDGTAEDEGIPEEGTGIDVVQSLPYPSTHEELGPGVGEEVDGLEATGVEATGVEATGVEATGVEAAGVEAAGLDAIGLEAIGLDATG